MDCGIIGLGTMGLALLENLLKNYKVSIYNRTSKKTQDAHEKFPKSTPFYDLNEFVNSLKKPRIIIILISSQALDIILEQLKLNDEDVVIDMGNTLYKETEARMAKYNFQIIGCGISGGEKGAKLGPSLMPSGDYNAYKKVEKILNDLCDNKCQYLGQQGCGHFVKMVHNGIEYGNMSIIAEIHMLLKKQMSNEEISRVFKQWNTKHEAYLLEIAEQILRHDKYDDVEDIVNNKGTGIWTVISAMEEQINVNILCAAMGERMVSHAKDLRKMFFANIQKQENNKEETPKKQKTNDKCKCKDDCDCKKKINLEINIDDTELVDVCYNAYALCTTLSYLQGLNLIKQTSIKRNYDLDMKKVCDAWKHGCIIRSKDIESLEKMTDDCENSETFLSQYRENIQGLRSFAKFAIDQKCSVPTIMACLSYIDGFGSNVGSLLAAMRDCFGSHKVDLKNGEKDVHIEWEQQ